MSLYLINPDGNVRDWAPPGWHWEVLPSGARSLVRNPGVVVDPDLLWWHSHGPHSVQREPAPEEAVRRRIREEDEHVRRYMYLLDNDINRRWSIIQRDPYHPVMVLALWRQSARGSAPRGLGPGQS